MTGFMSFIINRLAGIPCTGQAASNGCGINVLQATAPLSVQLIERLPVIKISFAESLR
jgi:hypothetical protein